MEPNGTRTTTNGFRKAERKFAYLKVGIEGPSGAGKTMGALLVAKGLASSTDKICFIDTENGSGELYANDPRIGYDYAYQSILPPFAPAKYVTCLKEAVDARFEVAIIDSQSHAWKYILDYKEKLDQQPRSNSYTNWGKAKPLYDELKTAILFSPMHVIVCFRSKTEYAMQTGTSKDGGTKNIVTKLGMNPIAEPENEYEFTVVFSVDKSHLASTMMTGKDRTGLFEHDAGFKLTEETGEKLKAWLGGTGFEVVESQEWKSIQAPTVELARATAEAAALEKTDAPKPLSPEGAYLVEVMPDKEERKAWKGDLAALGADVRAIMVAAMIEGHPLELLRAIRDAKDKAEIPAIVEKALALVEADKLTGLDVTTQAPVVAEAVVAEPAPVAAVVEPADEPLMLKIVNQKTGETKLVESEGYDPFDDENEDWVIAPILAAEVLTPESGPLVEPATTKKAKGAA